MTALLASTTTLGDWTMYGSLAMLGVLGIIAAMSSSWFKTNRRDA